MQLGEWIGAPSWLQVFVFAAPCMVSSSTLMRNQHLYDVCAAKPPAETHLLYGASLLFRNWGSSCPAFERWMQAYGACYVGPPLLAPDGEARA